MKISILGGAGVRMPLMVQAMLRRQDHIGLTELALMDIDGERLDLIGALTLPLECSGKLHFRITRTTDARAALTSADYVITTFRVGGIESRIVDERVPLECGVLGQETTGPGGFAMAMRTIPVLLDYVQLMRQVCPDAWLINFANPAGLLTQALVRVAQQERAVGICDSPNAIRQSMTMLAPSVPPDEVFFDYFGLNHLGWVRSLVHDRRDYLPPFIEMLCHSTRGIHGLPFDPQFLAALRMIPNEYLYYFYHSAEAVRNILASGQCRGEQVAALNLGLFEDLRQLKEAGNLDGMVARYEAYLNERGQTYMACETGRQSAREDAPAVGAAADEGYAGVALDLIEALTGAHPRHLILNVSNRGAIPAMSDDDVVEIPACVERGLIRPLTVGDVPDHCLGLMKQVKAYERLTIAAATEGSYAQAVAALTVHPLVRDHAAAKAILDQYRVKHGATFPMLQ